MTAQGLALSRPEGDDAAYRVVGGYTHGHAITWNNFDPEAAHAAAQLREHFVSGITLHAIEPTRMDRHYGALHVYQIVFAQYLILFAEAGIPSALRNSAPAA